MPADATPDAVGNRLSDIQSLTDAALSRLDDQDFLAELLDRTKDILQADTAAVLLMDYSAGQLIATAAVGLEEEVRQGVRVPVGRGFAGKIAAQHRPVIIDHVAPDTVLNPILIAKGIRTMAGVPLIAAGRVIGVMHVGSLTRREFTSEDVALLQLAADRAANAVQSLANRDDRIAAEALQRSLVPAPPPVVLGAEIAARYVPGHGAVGGDWYDVFLLPSGELGVVIGDVAGSGLQAAVIMGRMRSALRAYALQTPDPAEVLGKLDQKMQHFEPGALATVLYATINPSLDQAHVASAGHLPPVVASPGQAAVLADLPNNLMIGVDATIRRQTTTVKITPGEVLCFYTDGLVERRDCPIDDGLAALCHAVTAAPPEQVCASVMDVMVGAEPAHDDIALLVVRRSLRALSQAERDQAERGQAPGGYLMSP